MSIFKPDPKRKHCVGIDFGKTDARIAVFDPSSESLALAAEVEWAKETSIADVEKIIAGPLASLGEGWDVVFSMPSSGVFATYIELPLLKKSEISEALNSRVRRGFYFRDEEYSIFNTELNPWSGDIKKKGYLVALIPKESLAYEAQILKDLGYSVQSIEMPFSALLRWTTWEKPELKNGSYLILYFRADEIMALVIFNGVVSFARSFEMPLNGLSAWREGRLGDFSDEEPFVADFVKRLQCIIAFQCFRRFPTEAFLDGVTLTGINSGNPHLLDYVRRTLGIPVDFLSGHRVRVGEGEPEGPAYQKWAIAAGLSMKAMEITSQ